MTGEPRLHVTAVVPLYRPAEGQVTALSRLLRQVDEVIAVDDGSGPDAALDGVDARVVLIRLPTNRGIARCLNEGVLVARARGATHVLTLDQDSRLPDEYVDRGLSLLEDLQRAGVQVGGVGAGRVGPHRVDGAVVSGDARVGLDGIQSGWLLPVEVFDAVGLFDEGLFIDCVDVDFLMRAAGVGRQIVVTDRCAIEHALGADEHAVHLLGRRIVFSYHPPFRRYYITRNRVTMLQRYAIAQPGATVGQFLVAARIAVLCLVLGRARRAQLIAIWAGALHGLAGRGGAIPRRTRRALERAGRQPTRRRVRRRRRPSDRGGARPCGPTG